MRDKIIFGQTTKKRKLSDSVLKRIAVHEIGHLLAGLSSPHVEKPEKVVIDVNNYNSLGYTMFEVDDLNEGLYTREYLEDKIKVLLGGRVGEEVIFGLSISSGAISDLELAFSIAKEMVISYGMGNKVIYPHFSEQYKKEIDDEINQLINNAYKNVKKLFEGNKALILTLSEELIENKSLNMIQITNIIENFNIYDIIDIET